ncbi:microtubule-associated protein 9-like isoform X2 [Hypanus sabinus]|uniref:microtubule-associated protein 9-like isoform X2 n=1 Tax=Hypanus sabinus TaxID=79690 RepID=UPI0028C47D93|nr:microtubule-associated protein 9-like isoform X2 [Hypanus sabinus]
MFQDELHKTVVAGVMKLSSVEENACSDFDFEKEVKNSTRDESPKPKPRYSFLKRESNHGRSNELEKQDGNLLNTHCSTSDSKLSRTVNVYKLDSSIFCPEEKPQTEMKLMGIESQNPETNGKSKSRRSLNSSVESLECSSIGKSPQSKTTEPRYLGTLKILDRKANETSNLEATDTIRASIYQEWLERKRQVLSENKRHRKLKVQQENVKREQNNIANKKEAKASFEAWKTRKKNAFQETYQKKKEEEKIKQQAEAEKEVFEKWKEGKDRYLQENLQKQKQIKKENREKEKEQVNERKEGNASAFMKWNEEKEMIMKQRMIEITKVQQKKKREEEYSKCEREEMAALVYKKWLAEKGKNEKKQKQMKSVLCRDPLPPWSPPNKTIPFGK